MNPVQRAVEQALAILAMCAHANEPGHVHPTVSTLASFYETVYELAPLGSEWSGYQESREWWVACVWTVTQHESNQHNDPSRCKTPTPGSIGFSGIESPAWRRACEALGQPLPCETFECACYDSVDNPEKQAKADIRTMALYLRQTKGNVNRAWQFWRWGRTSGDDYAKINRQIWRKRWPHVPFRTNLRRLP